MRHYVTEPPEWKRKSKSSGVSPSFVKAAVADERLPTSSAAEQVRSQRTANCTPKWRPSASASIYQWIEIGCAIALFVAFPKLTMTRPAGVAAVNPRTRIEALTFFAFTSTNSRARGLAVPRVPRQQIASVRGLCHATPPGFMASQLSTSHPARARSCENSIGRLLV